MNSCRFSRVGVMIGDFISFMNKLDVFLKVSKAFDNDGFSGHWTRLCKDGTGIFTNTFTLFVDEEIAIFPVLVVVMPCLMEHDFGIALHGCMIMKDSSMASAMT